MLGAGRRDDAEGRFDRVGNVGGVKPVLPAKLRIVRVRRVESEFCRELDRMCGQECGVDPAGLYDEHVDAVYLYVARRLGPELARDVIADVFEAAIAGLNGFDPARGSARAWLFGIATNLMRRHWRTEVRRLRAWERAGAQVGVTGDPLLGVEDRIDATRRVADVMAAIGDLSPDDRDLLLLIAWEGAPYAACAAILDIPVGTVRSRLNRIRRDLRSAIELPREEAHS